MITIRNAKTAQSVSARASTADLKPGMIVAFVAGAANGDQPKVRKATIAEIADATVLKGIVDYIPADSDAVDFTIVPATQVLTPVDDTIPLDAQVNVWFNKPIVAYHESKLPAGLKPTTQREGTKVAFDGDTALPAAYNAGGADGTQVIMGMVYRNDGPEMTIVFTGL
jgi:hypothetical protein